MRPHNRPQMFIASSRRSWRQRVNYQESLSARLAHWAYCTPPVAVAWIPQAPFQPFFVLTFSSSTGSTNSDVLFYSLTSCSQSVISVDVSALVELLRIPAFFKKKFAACLGGALALVEVENLGNNISTSHWLLSICNRSACIASIAFYEIQSVKH